MRKAKDEIKDFIEKVPDDISFDDLIYEIYVNHQIQKGLLQLEQGKTVPFDEAKKKLLKK